MQAKLATATVTLLMACALLFLTAADASARGWFRNGYAKSWSTPGWSHSATVSRTPGNNTGTRSFQTPGGYGATRNYSRGCSGGTCTNNVSTTTNSGKTWSHSGSVTGSNGTASWQKSGSGPNGGTSSHSGSCTSGAGCTSNGSVTAANGNTWTGQRSVTPNGQGGYNYNATYTGPNGTVTSSGP